MAVLTKVGSFDAPVATGNQAITGVGFQPKALMLFASGGDVPDAVTTNFMAFVGFATSPSDQGAANVAGIATLSSYVLRRITASYVLYQTNASSSVFVRRATLASFDADGFTLNHDEARSDGDYSIIHYVAIGGDDISAKVIVRNAATVAGNEAITGIGFQPDTLLTASVQDVPGLDSIVSSGGLLSLGMADNLMAQGGVSFGPTGSASGYTDSQAQSVLGMPSTGGGYASEGRLASYDADGFTVDWVTPETDSRDTPYVALALRGVKSQVSAITKGTSTAPVAQSIAGIGFEPKFVLLSSNQRPSAANPERPSGFINMGIGAFTLADQVDAQWGIGNATSERRSYASRSHALAMLTHDASSTLNAEATSAVDADGFTLTWAPNDATAAEVLYLAIGEAITDITVTLPVTTATGSAPVLTAVGGAGTSLAVTTGSGAAPSPTATGGAVGAISPATASATAPTITVTSGATTTLTAATGSAEAPALTAVGGSGGQLPTTTAFAEAPPPIVSTGPPPTIAALPEATATASAPAITASAGAAMVMGFQEVEPTLLLSPTVNQGRDGTASIAAENGQVTVVPGRYGPAWYSGAGTTNYQRWSVPAGALQTDAGTVLFRLAASNIGNQAQTLKLLKENPAQIGVAMGRYIRDQAGYEMRTYWTFGNGRAALPQIPDDTFFDIGMSWSGQTGPIQMYVDAVRTLSVGAGDYSLANDQALVRWFQIGGSISGGVYGEGALLFDANLSEAQVVALQAMPRAWSWESVTEIFRGPVAATATVEAPEVREVYGADVALPAATASAMAQAPTASGGSRATLVAASASGQATTPATTTGAAVTLVPASANANTPVPTAAVVYPVFVTLTTGLGSAQALPFTVLLGAGASLSPAIATATALAFSAGMRVTPALVGRDLIEYPDLPILIPDLIEAPRALLLTGEL